jgi:hypothetical protein
MLRLMTLVQVASRTGDYPRLDRRSAENVLRVIADWLEGEHHAADTKEVNRLDVAREIRDQILIARGQK